MSNTNKVKQIMNGGTDLRAKMILGQNNVAKPVADPVVPEKKEEVSKEISDHIDIAAITGDFHEENSPVKPKKILKGIYIEEDVLAVYLQQQEIKKRGWGSQLVSDLLRKVFEAEGLMDKK